MWKCGLSSAHVYSKHYFKNKIAKLCSEAGKQFKFFPLSLTSDVDIIHF